jgi:hypothetical protein
MRNTADVTGGKPIALLQSIPGVSAINPLVAFCDIHGGKRVVLFFYFVLDTTRDMGTFNRLIMIILICVLFLFSRIQITYGGTRLRQNSLKTTRR